MLSRLELERRRSASSSVRNPDEIGTLGRVGAGVGVAGVGGTRSWRGGAADGAGGLYAIREGLREGAGDGAGAGVYWILP